MAKYIEQNNGTLTEKNPLIISTGVSDANKIIQTDSTGKLDSSLMPVGIAPEADDIVLSENVSAGDYINFHNSTGLKARKADGSSSGKEANGFTLTSGTTGQTIKVYRISQTNTQLTGRTAGAKLYLSVTVPGSVQETVPTGSGQVIQFLGFAKSATESVFSPNDPIVLA